MRRGLVKKGKKLIICRISFVNFLTKVVGKAIGLVGKGILQGLGRANTK